MRLGNAARSSVGHDDYALERVPEEARYSWWVMAAQRFGQLSDLSGFLLGAALGFGMAFRDAFLAIALGTLILEAVALLAGLAGQREGLSTSVLARWTGFGQVGSALIGLAIAISLIGWFGIQSALSAESLASLVGVLPVWAWSLVFGLAVTAIVVYGFGSMAWTAYITIPAMMLLVGWSVGSELADHSLGELMTSGHAGPALSLAQGTVLVVGGFIAGAVIAPDMTRFNRSRADVAKQTVVGITLGQFPFALAGVLLAQALETSDIVEIVTSTSGTVGVLIIISATLKINDWNLYSASLGIVNFTQTVFGLRLNRASVTVVVGILGSVLAAVGILDRFTDFLILLGVVFPPVGGILIAEYFLVRAFTGELDTDRETGGVPASCPSVVPATLAVWAAGSLVGHYVDWGVDSLNALATSFLLYLGLGRLGLVKPFGRAVVVPDEAAPRVDFGKTVGSES